MNKIIDLMCKCGAAKAAAVNYSDCEIINPRLAENLRFEPQTVFVGIIPYYSHFCDEPRSVSAYALAYDYHIYIKDISELIVKSARELYPDANFAWFGDHSPINEKLAAAKAGLGIIGEHSLLITPEYSSFVFLFEIITDIKYDLVPKEVVGCEKCNKCSAACPANIYDKRTCLSAVTQKKKELSDEDRILIKENRCAWGCDICQTVCPHTINAISSGSIYSDIPWFNDNIISFPTQDTVADSDDFSRRAYSWRGTKTILRNVEIIATEIDNKQ